MRRRELFKFLAASPAAWLLAKYGPLSAMPSFLLEDLEFLQMRDLIRNEFLKQCPKTKFDGTYIGMIIDFQAKTEVAVRRHFSEVYQLMLPPIGGTA